MPRTIALERCTCATTGTSPTAVSYTHLHAAQRIPCPVRVGDRAVEDVLGFVETLLVNQLMRPVVFLGGPIGAVVAQRLGRQKLGQQRQQAIYRRRMGFARHRGQIRLYCLPTVVALPKQTMGKVVERSRYRHGLLALGAGKQCRILQRGEWILLFDDHQRRPVSYTHLDVYKRQDVHFEGETGADH